MKVSRQSWRIQRKFRSSSELFSFVLVSFQLPTPSVHRQFALVPPSTLARDLLSQSSTPTDSRKLELRRQQPSDSVQAPMFQVNKVRVHEVTLRLCYGTISQSYSTFSLISRHSATQNTAAVIATANNNPHRLATGDFRSSLHLPGSAGCVASL